MLKNVKRSSRFYKIIKSEIIKGAEDAFKKLGMNMGDIEDLSIFECYKNEYEKENGNKRKTIIVLHIFPPRTNND